MWWLFLLPPALALVHEPPPPAAPAAAAEPVEMTFRARLNQFDASNTETFDMRFYYNDPFNASEYVLVLVGGAWRVSPGWLRAGLAHETARDLGAALFYTEHRYYGSSRPTNDTAAAQLRWLTSEQALEDLAQFLRHVTSDDFLEGRYRGAKVGLMGCSYGGSLASWLRRSHPHLVSVAVSDSGPLVAQVDFPEYLSAVGAALAAAGGAACPAAVEDAARGLRTLLDTAAGRAELDGLFNTCQPLSAAPLDQAAFQWRGVSGPLGGLAQRARPGDVRAACAALTNQTIGDPVQRLAAWVTSRSDAPLCVTASYDAVVAELTDTSYDAPAAAMRLWTYQSCVEFGWFQSTSGDDQPFLDSVPLEFFHQLCRDLFGPSFTEARTGAGAARTNTRRGARAAAARAAAVVGGADPWAPVGPRPGAGGPLAPVFFVPEMSHCGALQPSSSEPALRAAQDGVKRFVAQQLTGSAAAAPRAAAAAALAAAATLLRLAM